MQRLSHSVLTVVLGLCIISALMTAFVFQGLAPKRIFEFSSLLLTIEVSGAVIALWIAVLLKNALDMDESGSYRYTIGGLAGLIVFSLFSLSGVLSSQDLGAHILFKSLSNIGGGLLFASVSLSLMRSILNYGIWIPRLAGGTLLISLGCMLFYTTMPKMIVQGDFTLLARLMNITGGVFFLGPVPFLFRRSYLKQNRHDFFLMVFCMSCGVAACLYAFSRPWSANWWISYFLQFAAFILAVMYATGFQHRLQRRLQDGTISLAQCDYALKESEERYRQLFELSPDGIGVHQNGKIVLVNSVLVALLGAKHPKELVGHSILDFLDPNVTQRTKDRLAGVDFKPAASPFDAIFCSKQGKCIDAEVAVSSVTYMGADACQFIVRDQSERKKNEMERTSLQERLQRAKKMEALGLMAGGVAHDLNNILSGLVSYPELLLMQIPEDSPLRKPIQTIMHSGERAAAIVQDLLMLSRRGVALFEVVNINEVLMHYSSSPEFIQLKDYHPHIQFQFRSDPELLCIKGSPAHLGKLMLHLVTNAAESMPQGGMVYVNTENISLDTDLKGYEDVPAGDYVVLSVSDRGKGISPEDISRIFEPFYSKKNMGRGGSGLGLSLVWGTVKDHEGFIDIQSVPETGTVFRIFLPITATKQDGRCMCAQPMEIQGRGECILVIDDMPEQRDLAFLILSDLGYDVICKSSGEEALEFLKTQRVDLVLLDMIMDPGIDGLETYRRILDIHPRQKAVLVSGYSETCRVQEAQRLGAGSYIKKPYRLEKIGQAVKQELSM